MRRPLSRSDKNISDMLGSKNRQKTLRVVKGMKDVKHYYPVPAACAELSGVAERHTRYPKQRLESMEIHDFSLIFHQIG